MATSGFIPVHFCSVIKNTFYFRAGKTDTKLDSDDFMMSDNSRHCWIQCSSNKFLLLNDDEKFQGEFYTTYQQQTQPECKFHIQYYKDSSLEEKQGEAVMLYVIKDGEKMMVCCSEKHDVYSEALDTPPKLEGNTHKAMFYIKRQPSVSNNYTFESTLCPSWFLALESDEQNSSLNKLVLRKKDGDAVDKSCEFSVFPCPE